MSRAVLAGALASVIISGGSTEATRIALSAISAVDVSSLDAVIGGLLPLTLLLGIGLPPRVPQKWLLLSGICGFIAFRLPFTLGVRQTSASPRR